MNTKNYKKSGRLESIDALRGFDMFWITGGGALIGSLAKSTNAGWITLLNNQMEHVRWNGFHFEDLIFPLFMFISGVVIPFTLVSKIEDGILKKSLTMKALKRMVILVILGFFYNKLFEKGFHGRYASVLGQIGIAYFFAALITIYTNALRSRLFWLLWIIGFVTTLQLFIPVPGAGAGVLTPKGCINGFIDRLLLPGKLFYNIIDPEGTLCIISATGIILLGSFAGYLLREKRYSDWEKVGYLAIAGSVLIVAALSSSPFYPIIKKCWTSSYVMLAGGISALLVALFYMIIDVLKWRKWDLFFRVIGMNSIFIYLFVKFIDVKKMAHILLGWSAPFTGDFYPFLNVVEGIALTWMLLYYMYKKNIFLKV